MTVKMLTWEPGQQMARTRPVTGATEVEEAADALLKRYHTTGQLPGIELQSRKNESLSIAVAPDGWALIHTDHTLVQYCTKRTGDEAKSVDVRWEEITSIPAQWFVPKPLAMAGLAQWLADGTRSPQLPWSDQCF